MHQHPTAETTNTTSSRKLSPAMQELLDGMDSGMGLTYSIRRNVGVYEMDGLPVRKITVMALLGRGLIRRMADSREGQQYDRYTLTEAGAKAVRPVISDLRAAVAPDDMLTGDDTSDETVRLITLIESGEHLHYSDTKAVYHVLRLQQSLPYRITGWAEDGSFYGSNPKCLLWQDFATVGELIAAMSSLAAPENWGKRTPMYAPVIISTSEAQ